ncbi:hypothetical protein AO1008_08097 [Aspergillus oryzae 100-8]|uniref:Glycan binding protein Y3-like domain-containing protein n=1 Tax=Aspergillus oryzae (strain 3.042) TaxID=1160506 RepID=I8U0G8_ASPO3|nr:hypothetical protein Ao3042_03382 [Aspergillus oryzae 3.042]KDE81658.1 hypothetical protein AO1008_08097 [Aspergillus oryzae 100-8]|eukprot:EIT80093.1 hypothetical protein Ao3042_03382 [Aspergillus oryzae 3.042]
MHFQALPILAAMLALPALIMGEPDCPYGGYWTWSHEEARSAAAHGIDKWCNNIAPSTFKGGQEVTQCLEVDYDPKNVNLWMKNDSSGDKVLSIDQCKRLLKKIVDSCPAGGSDRTLDGWAPHIVIVPNPGI